MRGNRVVKNDGYFKQKYADMRGNRVVGNDGYFHSIPFTVILNLVIYFVLPFNPRQKQVHSALK